MLRESGRLHGKIAEYFVDEGRKGKTYSVSEGKFEKKTFFFHFFALLQQDKNKFFVTVCGNYSKEAVDRECSNRVVLACGIVGAKVREELSRRN